MQNDILLTTLCSSTHACMYSLTLCLCIRVARLFDNHRRSQITTAPTRSTPRPGSMRCYLSCYHTIPLLTGKPKSMQCSKGATANSLLSTISCALLLCPRSPSLSNNTADIHLVHCSSPIYPSNTRANIDFMHCPRPQSTPPTPERTSCTVHVPNLSLQYQSGHTFRGEVGVSIVDPISS